jgi:SAM-dependent methyltransferase
MEAMERLSGADAWMAYLIREVEKPPGGLRVLELGPGCLPSVARYLEGQFAIYVAVDNRADLLENQMVRLKILEMYERTLQVVLDTSTGLPFASGSFDLVVAAFHPPLVQPGLVRAKLFQEMVRVLADNGQIIVVPWNDEYHSDLRLGKVIFPTNPPREPKPEPGWGRERICVAKKKP